MDKFISPALLQSEYVKKLSKSDEGAKACDRFNPFRSCQVLLDNLTAVFNYDSGQAKRFTRRIVTEQNDFKNCEAVAAR